MAKIAQTATMYLDEGLGHYGLEWFKARGKKGSGRQAVICGWVLREYFKLPKKVTELWLIAHDAPTSGSLHVSLRIDSMDWVYCHIVDKDVEFTTSHIFDGRMDQYLIKRLRLTEDDVKDIYVTCEYR